MTTPPPAYPDPLSRVFAAIACAVLLIGFLAVLGVLCDRLEQRAARRKAEAALRKAQAEYIPWLEAEFEAGRTVSEP